MGIRFIDFLSTLPILCCFWPKMVFAHASSFPKCTQDGGVYATFSAVKRNLSHPVEFTAPNVLAQPVWADPPVPSDVDWEKRHSYTGEIQLSKEKYPCIPINPPEGKLTACGVTGRGLLGKWGPNFAADPIVSTFKRDASGAIVTNAGKPILQVVLIQRKDTGEFALPGGMVDFGEKLSLTAKREFSEEALNFLESSEKEKKEANELIDTLFASENAQLIYQGIVDDPRNTNNAWMETSVFVFHDKTGETFRFLERKLNAGDDAQAVKVVDITAAIQLYASHKHFIQLACEKLGAAF
eukprot:GCRY01001269.1.p1 GENE.GCRY01001269.1~~GCRY01001269.1.p1  ORF type:complete len:297 (-),score=57.16 GCRY01001269.1:239-1129(-)